MDRPVVLVTGASAGIGRCTVDALSPACAQVYAGSRSHAGFAQDNVTWLPLDVRDAASVRAAVRTVLDRSGRIDAVVNNAGVMLGGLVEETDLQVAHSLFDTNFWGVAETTQQVLPTLRAQRSGKVIIVGSLAGRVGTPGQAFYSAAKFALEGYAETLAAEVASFGIRVHLVEPGFHRTDLHRHMLAGGLRVDDYDAVRTKVDRATQVGIQRGGDPEAVAARIAQLVTGNDARLRHPVGNDARWVPRLKSLVPEALFRSVVRRKFGLRGSL